ncbi:MAG: hypothetical protein IKI29_02380 [Clostridia bacterium]|nr:hypothetical protein [Clostridia bacterium]
MKAEIRKGRFCRKAKCRPSGGRSTSPGACRRRQTPSESGDRKAETQKWAETVF